MDPHSLALAYALSAIAGLRASLTVLAVSIAIHVHAYAPPSELAWLGSNVTLAIAVVFAVADFIGDKVPVVDHLVHLTHGVLAPLVGGIAAAGIDGGSPGATMLAAVLGGTNAFAVLGLRATTRGGSSAVSAGMLNPVLSVLEDVIAGAGLALAFVAPVAVALALLVTTVAFVLLARRVMRAARASTAVTAAARETPAR